MSGHRRAGLLLRASRTGARAMLAGLLAALGCSGTPPTSSAKLVGAQNMALVQRESGGLFLFVTSTDADELRVLELGIANSERFAAFVPAPNPLEALSIPVVQGSSHLAADEGYADGQRVNGPYVYATRPGAAEVSVVGTADDELREVRRLSLPGALTAVASWYSSGSTRSRLFVSVWDGGRSAIYRIDLPPPAELRALSPTAVANAFQLVATFDGESIAALLPLPGLDGRTAADGRPFCAGNETCLAIATRSERGSTGRTLVFEPGTGRSVPAGFGAPVRTLVTHARVRNDDGATIIEAGRRIFALLGEESCGGPGCGGVLAVDTLFAQRSGFPLASDAVGLPMLPLRVGAALPTSLSVAANHLVVLPPHLSSAGLTSWGLLGAVTASSGEVTLFDAVGLRPFDTNSAPTVVEGASFHRADGTVLPWIEGPILSEPGVPDAVQLADGDWHSQSIYVVWEGIIPGLVLLPASGPRLTIPAAAAEHVRPGDIVSLVNQAGDCGFATVTQVSSTALEVDRIPAACAGLAQFTVRAGPSAPFVVTGSVSGYLGRASPGAFFAYRGPGVWRPDTFSATAPSLRLKFGRATDIAAPERGAYWQLDVNANYRPYTLAVDTERTECPGAQVPTSITLEPRADRIFVAYPSPGDMVAEINPAFVIPNPLANWQLVGSAAVKCYR